MFPRIARGSVSTARILVVDDDDAVRGVLKVLLERVGYKVAAVSNGPDALALVRAGEADLVLLDIEMPGMNGFDVCAQMHADPQMRLIPVLIMTGRPIDGVPEKVQAVGAVELIPKPFDRHSLLEKLKVHLSARD